MKNSVIGGALAIIVLLVGFCFGRVSNPTQTQTIFKTNFNERIVEKVVEKPVEVYVDKFITNILVITNLTETQEKLIQFADKTLNGNRLSFGELPLIESINVDVYLADEFKTILPENFLKDKIEVQLINQGIKIDERSKYTLNINLSGLKINDGDQYAYSKRMSVSCVTMIYDFENEIGYKDVSEIWSQSNTGVAGKKVANQDFISNAFTIYMDSLINSILKSRSRFKMEE